MDAAHCEVMSAAYGDGLWKIDAGGVSLAHRPRLYWASWVVRAREGVSVTPGSEGHCLGEIQLTALVNEKEFVKDTPLPTFTTAWAKTSRSKSVR